MTEPKTITIPQPFVSGAAAFARGCASIAARERVVVSQSVALALRAELERVGGLEIRDGRSSVLKFVDLLDVCDFTAGGWQVESRATTAVERPGLYVPTMPLMVGVLSDVYVAAEVDADLRRVELLGFAMHEDLGSAELSGNGLFAILDAEELRPFDELVAFLRQAKPATEPTAYEFDEWQARAERVIRAMNDILSAEGVFGAEHVARMAAILRDGILRIYGERLPETGLEPLFDRLFRRFGLRQPIPARPGSPLAFDLPSEDRPTAASSTTSKEFFEDGLSVGERVGLYQHLLADDTAAEHHQRSRRVLDRATAGRQHASTPSRMRRAAIQAARSVTQSLDLPPRSGQTEADNLTLRHPESVDMSDIPMTLHPGQILTGSLFSEPMRVETVDTAGTATWVVGLVGLHSERFRRVTLTEDDLRQLTRIDADFSFAGDGRLLRLGLQAYALGIAYEFDPYFGLSISRVDPLPHQLEAVYEHLLKLARVRFLLADDAGAGKTIMAGLLIRELELRGLAERILIVCPANLAFQWQRELKEKFDTKFLVMKGQDLREQFGVNQWMERNRVITSLDLAKRDDILPGLRQVHWDLVIVDEAHRMSASDESHKSKRYRLGELLRDSSDHILLLTATPHKGDPKNFSLFLQLLDSDAYADVVSIREAMKQRRAPFYLRRTKEAMVYFPERSADGSWAAKPIFTKRIPHTADFEMDGAEFELYREVTRFVKRESARAAAEGEDPRARAIGFLMSLYQRRLASSTRAMRRSLENRARRLEENLRRAQALVRLSPPDLPDPEEVEEMEDAEREHLEQLLEAITLATSADQVRREVRELRLLAEQALAVEESGGEAKLTKLRELLQREGFFDDPGQRLLLFTEFKDTLDYLVERLKQWGFRVGFIHGGMKPGSRDEPGSRLNAEQQFREGEIQVLVATEAAGEGINLQACNILFNYDIPWNPNRLEQRMGRIHRYGQRKDCLIFNFVATNTVEGKVLQRLLEKLQEIRDALDDDAVFNVVGEVLPAAHVERVLRDYYSGRLGDADLEDRLLHNVDERQFRAICQNALEGLASKKLNLEMLIERRARAQEQRVVPETIARFLGEAAEFVPWALKPVPSVPHAFDPARTPSVLRHYESESDWKLPALADRYPRCSTDRDTAETEKLEWVTPGHPLFEAMRRHTHARATPDLAKGATFHSLQHEAPARIDFYRARIVDGLAHIVHERLFAVEIDTHGEPRLQEAGLLGNFTPAAAPADLPSVARLPEATAWLHEHALAGFLDDARGDRLSEVERIGAHVELSLTELLQRADEEIGKAASDVEQKFPGAEGRLAMAESRHAELLLRRERRRADLERQRALTLQGVERLASVLVLPHPEREAPELRRLKPSLETEVAAMRVVMEHERALGRQVYDVSEKNLGYDVTSLDLASGELRLIEVKGLGAATGTVLLTPNERRVAQDRPDCFWLYVVTNCDLEPVLQEPIRDPARLEWTEVSKVAHYYLSLEAMKKPMPQPNDLPTDGES